MSGGDRNGVCFNGGELGGNNQAGRGPVDHRKGRRSTSPVLLEGEGTVFAPGWTSPGRDG